MRSETKPRRMRRNPIVVAALLSAVIVPCTAAQPALFDARPYYLTSGETGERLWVIRSSASSSRVFARDVHGSLELVRQGLSGRVAAAAATGDRLFLLFDDRTLYSLRIATPRLANEVLLPRSGLPLAMTAANGRLWALIENQVATALLDDPNASERWTSTDLARTDRLWLAEYNGRAWRVRGPSAPKPEAATPPNLRPRIVTANEQIIVLWADRMTLHWQTDIAGERPPVSANLPLAGGYWPAVVNGALVVVTIADPQQRPIRPEVWAVRLGADAPAPTRVKQSLPSLDDLDGVSTIDDVAAFNQQLAILVNAADDRRWLAYERLDDLEPLPPIALSDELVAATLPQQIDQFIQALRLFTIFSLGAAALLLRRTLPLELPQDQTLGGLPTRLIDGLIDFVPFAIATSALVDVSVPSAWDDLWRWSLINGVALPPANVLIWWGYAVAAYGVYATVMEMLTGRTVGKTLTGLRVVNEVGEPAARWQILVRNVSRMIELLPPLWPLLLVAVITAKRQRLGDVLARTVVVKRVNPTKPPADQPDDPM